MIFKTWRLALQGRGGKKNWAKMLINGAFQRGQGNSGGCGGEVKLTKCLFFG